MWRCIAHFREKVLAWDHEVKINKTEPAMSALVAPEAQKIGRAQANVMQ